MTRKRTPQPNDLAVPLQIVSSSELSDDYFATADVLIDSGAGKMAVYYNSMKAMTEAWIIFEQQLWYLAYDTTSASGWTVTQPSGYESIGATQVVAVVLPDGTPNIIYADGNNNLYQGSMSTEDGSWQPPSPLESNQQQLVARGPLLVAYDTATNAPVVYWAADTYDVGIYGWSGTEWSYNAWGIPGFTDILLLVVNKGLVSLYYDYSEVDGGVSYVNGKLGASQSDNIPLPATTDTVKAMVAGVLGPGAPAYSEFWPAVTVLYLDSDGTFWSGNPSANDWLQLFPGQTFSSVTPALMQDGMLLFYAIDNSGVLWVIRQDPNNPWDSATQLFPQFLQPIPIDSGIGLMYWDQRPTDGPALFAMGTDFASLALNWQDPNTTVWMTRQVQQVQPQQYQATRYRTEITVYDANGNPVPSYALTVSVTSVTELAVNGQYYLLNSDQLQSISTDATGKATFATIAEDLNPATFTLSGQGDDLPNPVTIDPAQPIHSYFLGTSTLPSMGDQSTWSGTTVQNAQVDGQSLVPSSSWTSDLTADDFAKFVQSSAQAGFDAQSGNTASLSASPIVGFVARGGARPSLTVCTTREQLEAAMAQLPKRPLAVAPGIETGAVGRWLGDLWRGIKKAVITVTDWTVQLIDNAWNCTLHYLGQVYSFVINGIEDAFNAIVAAFNWIVAAIEKLIDWLKALFDFQAIMDTAVAIESALTALPPFLAGKIQTALQNYQDGFFQKQLSTVQGYFSSLGSKYGNTTFGGGAGSGWQPLGQPPSNNQQVGNTGLTPAGITNNPHVNWFMTSVGNNAPSTDLGLAQDLSDSFNTLYTNAQAAAATFQVALIGNPPGTGGLISSLQSIISQPSQFGNVTLTDFLGIVEAVVEALLIFGDAIAVALLNFGTDLLAGLEALFQMQLSAPLLNTLYGWVWNLAATQGWLVNGEPPGDPPDQMTVAQFMSIIVAFPVTILYKLINGVDTEPFPGGQWTQPDSAIVTAVSGSQASLMVSALAEALSSITSAISDVAGDETPWFITVGGLAFWAVADACSWPSFSSSTGADIGLWLSAAVQVVLDFVAPLCSSFNLGGVVEVVDQLMPLLLSVGGLAEFIFAIVAAIDGSEDLLTIIASLLTPLPTAFSFLTLPAIQDTEAGPPALAFKIILDFAGYGIGGGLELIDVMTT